EEGGARFEAIEANLFGAELDGSLAISDEGLASGKLGGKRVALSPIGTLAGIPLEGRADIEIELDAADGKQSIHALLSSRKIDMELTDRITLDRVVAEAKVSDALGDGALEAYFSAEGGGSGNTRFTQIEASAKGPFDKLAISAGIHGERLTVETQPVALKLDALYEASRLTLQTFDANVGDAEATLAAPATIEMTGGMTRLKSLDAAFTGPQGAGRL
ncbi:MAG TPA: hypothetical protein DHK64_12825, partial [Rhodobiaceae bacterium]|nr:hypothetical protein [Rhodobiaceae bacterium]